VQPSRRSRAKPAAIPCAQTAHGSARTTVATARTVQMHRMSLTQPTGRNDAIILRC
jgi:hypothetical protein